MIKYLPAPDVEERMKDLIVKLEMDHIDSLRVSCLRSKGTSTRNTIARCHGMSKVLQLGMSARPFYVIEVISEQFDRLDEDDKIKTIIHELMHIPKNFGGGFRHHDFVNHHNIKKMFKTYKERSNIVDNRPHLNTLRMAEEQAYEEIKEKQNRQDTTNAADSNKIESTNNLKIIEKKPKLWRFF